MPLGKENVFLWENNWMVLQIPERGMKRVSLTKEWLTVLYKKMVLFAESLTALQVLLWVDPDWKISPSLWLQYKKMHYRLGQSFEDQQGRVDGNPFYIQTFGSKWLNLNSNFLRKKKKKKTRKMKCVGFPSWEVDGWSHGPTEWYTSMVHCSRCGSSSESRDSKDTSLLVPLSLLAWHLLVLAFFSFL